MTDPTPIPRPLMALEQLQAILKRIPDQIEEALEADDTGRVPLLVALDDALQERRAEQVDTITQFILLLEGQAVLYQQQADVYQAEADKLTAAHGRIKAHVQDWIDRNLPEDAPKLTGKTSVLRTQQNTQAKLTYDAAAVPRELCSYTLTIRVPYTPLHSITAMKQIQDFALSVGPIGVRCKVAEDAAGTFYKLEPDERRIREHLEHHAEPWGRYEIGRHLRSKPSFAAAQKQGIIQL